MTHQVDWKQPCNTKILIAISADTLRLWKDKEKIIGEVKSKSDTCYIMSVNGLSFNNSLPFLLKFFQQLCFIVDLHCICGLFHLIVFLSAMSDRNSMFLYFLLFEVASIASVILTAIWILQYQVPLSHHFCFETYQSRIIYHLICLVNSIRG